MQLGLKYEKRWNILIKLYTVYPWFNIYYLYTQIQLHPPVSTVHHVLSGILYTTVHPLVCTPCECRCTLYYLCTLTLVCTPCNLRCTLYYLYTLQCPLYVHRVNSGVLYTVYLYTPQCPRCTEYTLVYSILPAHPSVCTLHRINSGFYTLCTFTPSSVHCTPCKLWFTLYYLPVHPPVSAVHL